MRPYTSIPTEADDKELLRIALEFMGHRSSCSLPASNFQKHQPCKCGKDALVALIRKSLNERGRP